MTLAVRPPEYFPRLEFAALMLLVDRFIVADTFPYSRQGTQNRCRIRTSQPGAGAAAWLTVPLVAGAPGRPLREVTIAPDDRWRRIHRKTLLHHYGSAPFFGQFWPEIEGMIDSPATTLADLTRNTVLWTARALRAPAEISFASELAGRADTLGEILEHQRPDELITLSESSTADGVAAERAGIGLRVVTFMEQTRRQNFPDFTPGCSVLDLILNHGPEAAHYLQRCLEPRHG